MERVERLLYGVWVGYIVCKLQTGVFSAGIRLRIHNSSEEPAPGSAAVGANPTHRLRDACCASPGPRTGKVGKVGSLTLTRYGVRMSLSWGICLPRCRGLFPGCLRSRRSRGGS